jgi:hypothetical protein
MSTSSIKEKYIYQDDIINIAQQNPIANSATLPQEQVWVNPPGLRCSYG